MISAGYPSGNCCLDNYIPVTYPTGHLWNPYPLLLGEADVWPKGFPTVLKKEPQQEFLNGAMEMVPSASIGLIQFLPTQSPPTTPRHPACSGPPILALGLKSLAHLTDADTLFSSSAIWSLFLPSGNLSVALRGLLSQPLLWRVGLHTAFSYSSLSTLSSLSENEEDFVTQNEIEVSLLHRLLKTDLSSCNSLPECLLLIYSQLERSSLIQVNAWLSDLESMGYKFPPLRRHRRFAYLTQGGRLEPSSIPRLKHSSSGVDEANFDTFYLSFSGSGSGDLFFPNSTFQQGRNALLRIALAHEVMLPFNIQFNC